MSATDIGQWSAIAILCLTLCFSFALIARLAKLVALLGEIVARLAG